MIRLFILITVCVVHVRGVAIEQAPQDKRAVLCAELIDDMRSGEPYLSIFEKYLSSRGKFSNDTLKRFLIDYTENLKRLINKYQLAVGSIVKYSADPDLAMRLGEHQGARGSSDLKFGLGVGKGRYLDVNPDDLYAVSLVGGKVTAVLWVLFDGEDRIISYCSSRNKEWVALERM